MTQTKYMSMTDDVNTIPTEIEETPKPQRKTPAKKSTPKSADVAEEAPKKKRTYKKKEAAPAAETPAPEAEKPVEAEEPPHKKVPEQFVKDLDEFAAILEANPAVLEPIREVFEYHLIDPIDRKTFPKIVNAMSMLLGPAATMVVMTSCHVNSAAFFEDLIYSCKENDRARASIWILQHLTAIYGNRVHKAYTLSSGTMDEDWHTIDVNTYRREGETPVWMVDVAINLYNGENSRIKMTPDSTLQFVEILATELADNVPLDQIDPGLLEKCKENCRKFMDKFYGAEEDVIEVEDDPAGYA